MCTKLENKKTPVPGVSFRCWESVIELCNIVHVDYLFKTEQRIPTVYNEWTPVPVHNCMETAYDDRCVPRHFFLSIFFMINHKKMMLLLLLFLNIFSLYNKWQITAVWTMSFCIYCNMCNNAVICSLKGRGDYFVL